MHIYTRYFYVVILIYFSSLTLLFAQAWQVFPPGMSSYYFQDDSLNYYRLKVDSAEINGNTTTYFLDPTLEAGGTVGWTCSGTTLGHVLTGNPIVQQQNRLIFSYWHFPITLPLNSDTLLNTFQQHTLHAFVVNKRDTLFNGVTDSIIEIKLTSTDTILNACLQDGSVILSKNNGLLSVISCLTYIGDSYASYPPGKTRRSTPNFDVTRVNDFEVGDVFHFYNFYLVGNSGDKKYQNYTILSKAVDSINHTFTYIYRFAEEYHKDYGPNQSWTYTYDTIQRTYDWWPIALDSTPYSLGAGGFSQFYDSWNATGRPAYGLQDGPFIVLYDTCFSTSSFDPQRHNETYVEGLGCVLSVSHSSQSGTSTSSGYYLTYFNKGGQTWGTAYNVGVVEHALEKITVFPNPAVDVLRLSGIYSNKPLRYVISDLSGKVLKTGFVSALEPEIDIRNLPSGVHFLTLNQVHVVKFMVIQH
jgi:hypothetical protein